MKQVIAVIGSILSMMNVCGQTVPRQLAQAVRSLEADPQMKYAIVSLYVADAATGEKIYAHQEKLGVAPASTQKLFTSAAALELLGKDFRYETEMGFVGNTSGKGANLFVFGSYDPTFGSWRYASTKPEIIMDRFIAAIKKKGIQDVPKVFYTASGTSDVKHIPGGWIMDDIGNYYGTGCWPLNWKENQYDIVLESSDWVKGPVKVSDVKKENGEKQQFLNMLSTAKKGSGDNAYIYFPMEGFRYLLSGTIPAGEKHFVISGAVPDAFQYFFTDFSAALRKEGIIKTAKDLPLLYLHVLSGTHNPTDTILYTHQSPPLDSINYWFLRKSVNLYGEALMKTIGWKKAGDGSTEKGVEVLRNFWESKGIDKAAMHILDGSGLSPQNRVTTEAEVKVLQYARQRPWYKEFYNALPEYNGMKMKSGSISGARAFAGYHTARNGKSYVFSIIINNYDGSSGQAVQKMYRVLDVLK